MRKCTYYSLFCTEKRFYNYFDDKSPVRIPYKVVADLSQAEAPLHVDDSPSTVGKNSSKYGYGLFWEN